MKKPYTVISQEFGRGPKSRASFATLAEASQYIRDRWQGVEYMDGKDAFHTDYCTYSLSGFTLLDVGTVTKGETESFYDRVFTFNPNV